MFNNKIRSFILNHFSWKKVAETVLLPFRHRKMLSWFNTVNYKSASLTPIEILLAMYVVSPIQCIDKEKKTICVCYSAHDQARIIHIYCKTHEKKNLNLFFTITKLVPCHMIIEGKGLLTFAHLCVTWSIKHHKSNTDREATLQTMEDKHRNIAALLHTALISCENSVLRFKGQ